MHSCYYLASQYPCKHISDSSVIQLQCSVTSIIIACMVQWLHPQMYTMPYTKMACIRRLIAPKPIGMSPPHMHITRYVYLRPLHGASFTRVACKVCQLWPLKDGLSKASLYTTPVWLTISHKGGNVEPPNTLRDRILPRFSIKTLAHRRPPLS